MIRFIRILELFAYFSRHYNFIIKFIIIVFLMIKSMHVFIYIYVFELNNYVFRIKKIE